LRVLYRCCTLAEQAPLTPATFSFVHPLITQIVLKGGIEPEDADTALEQLTLVLNLLGYQVGEGASCLNSDKYPGLLICTVHAVSNTAYPRLGMMRDVTRVLSSHLQLAKESTSLLISIGESTHMNATREELEFLLKSILVEESHARNAVLQALQVSHYPKRTSAISDALTKPFDLTDFDWSPALLVACHDSDTQNARLARHIWDDNGLDVVESYMEPLFQLLC
jgi:hypothetical protein